MSNTNTGTTVSVPSLLCVCVCVCVCVIIRTYSMSYFDTKSNKNHQTWASQAQKPVLQSFKQLQFIFRYYIYYIYKLTLTSVFPSSASPVQALAKRKSPLSTAILLPNSMSLGSPSAGKMSAMLTTPLWIRFAVWMISVISARERWLSKNISAV